MELRIDSAMGSMNEEIDIEKEGKDIMIGFNPKFLIDALRVIDDETVTIYLVNPRPRALSVTMKRTILT